MEADRLWTTAEVARALGVGASSIKRWSDDGVLNTVRTPGGHRRYTLAALHAFADQRGLSHDLPPLVDVPRTPKTTLLRALLRGDEEAVRTLLNPPGASLSERAAFLDDAAEALREIGHGWEEGRIGISDEHRATAMFCDAIDRLRPRTAKSGPMAVLACPPDELHELPLRMVRTVLEWNDWHTEYFGANLPFPWLRRVIERSRPRLVAMSARSPMAFGGREFEMLHQFALQHGAKLVVGGDWARGGPHRAMVPRFRSLHAFDRWLRKR